MLSVVSVLLVAGVASAQSLCHAISGAVSENPWLRRRLSPRFDVEEGVLRGLGYLRRSTGETRYLHSLARINNQEAVSRYLDNREKNTETYFRMQQINRAAREADPPAAAEPRAASRLARQQAPEGLNPAQYNRELGRLNWPVLLNNEVFAPEREMLDRAFAARSPADVGAASAFHSQVKMLPARWKRSCRTTSPLLSPAEYMAAKKFVLGLSVESQQPMIFGALASK